MNNPIKANLQLVYVSSIEHSTNFYKMIFKSDPVFSSPRYVAFAAGSDALWPCCTNRELNKLSLFPNFSLCSVHGNWFANF